MFRRTRRVTPLNVAHMAYDSLGAFYHEIAYPPAAIKGLIGWAILGPLITVIVRAIQIVVRGRRPAGAIGG